MHTGVTFWTEGGPSIGMGHIVRSLNIAREALALGLPVHFLVNKDRAATERIRQAGFQHIAYPLTSSNASRLASRVAVIDTKKDVTRQIRELKEHGRKVILIDNTVSSGADCVVVPSAVFRGEPCPSNTLAGSDYVVIGKNIISERLKAERPDPLGPLKVLVTMGGADPNGITLKVAEALRDVEDIKVTFVIGPAFRNRPAINALRQTAPENFSFAENVSDLAPLISRAHVAVTAAGTTIYELAYMGVPSILIANYREDSADLNAFEALGVSRGLGFHGEVEASAVREAVLGLAKDRVLLDSMSRKATALTDGKGAARIASIIDTFARGADEDYDITGLFYGAYNA